MSKTALITGITGQDGSHLAEYFSELGYEVHGVVRRVALEQPNQRLSRILHLRDRLHLHPASLESYPSIFQIFSRAKFDECYHLAAQSFVAESFGDGFSTMATNVNGTHYVLEALRTLQPACKFYFAGSSEMFGQVAESPQCESTRFHPRSPYGISKVAGHHLSMNYREAYGMFCCSGDSVQPHEGPQRGVEFVTRKISSSVARIKLGLETTLQLGNLEAKRDWGDTRRTMSKQCTRCCSSRSPTTMWWLRARPTVCVSFARSHSHMQGWIIASMWKLMRRSFARPKLNFSSEMPAKRGAS